MSKNLLIAFLKIKIKTLKFLLFSLKFFNILKFKMESLIKKIKRKIKFLFLTFENWIVLFNIL